MIDYFIVCHDQNEILKLRSKTKGFVFLFVGNQQYDLIESFSDVVICNKLPKNIEQYPKLCSFTAWYAVSNNNINKKQYSCFLEYDTEVLDQFQEKNLISVASGSRVCGYLREPIRDPMFKRSTPWLEVFTKQKYNMTIDEFIEYYCGEEYFWYCTTNFLVDNKILSDFNSWFYEISHQFREKELGSYMHERMFNIYCILNKYNVKYIPSVLNHLQLCSHSNKDLYSLSKENGTDLDLIYEEIMFEHVISSNKK